MNSVFNELNEVSQSYDHFSSLFKSSFKGTWTFFSQVESMLIMVVSSANKNMWFSIPSTISLKNIKKSNGPRMEPCGTPEVISTKHENLPSISTRWDRLDKIGRQPLQQFPPNTNFFKLIN